MPDPLTTVADEFAPAPLNVFDPKLAESVISRHGNAMRGAQSSDMLAKSTASNYDALAAKRREERDAMLATREDLDYAEKKESEAMRGDIIADMYETLRPTEEGFDERVTGFLGQAPPSVVKDPVFGEVLRGLTRRADTAEEERRKVREVDDRQKNTIEAIRERAKYGETMKFLTEEDIATLPKDENGNPDMFAAGMLAGQRKREAGVEDYGKKVEMRKNATIDILNTKNMDAQQRDLYDETKNIIINDRSAFPNRTEEVLRLAVADKKSADPSILKSDPKWGPELAKAQAWDKDLFENEVLVAMEAKTPDEYVNYREGLTPTQRSRRKRLWDYAHQNDGDAPTAAPVAPTAPATAPAAPNYTEATLPDGTLVRRYSDGSVKMKKPK